MTLPEYIEQTRSTDLVNTVKHAALGLISEIGEVYGVLAKIERGDRIDRAERMTGELGDVAWYLARLTDLAAPSLLAPDLDPPLTFQAYDCLQDPFDDLAARLSDFGFMYLQHPGGASRDGWHRLSWSRWARLCSIESLDPLTVLESNLAKLRDRAARRVLQGDGDHR
jgi:hypothetical protein